MQTTEIRYIRNVRYKNPDSAFGESVTDDNFITKESGTVETVSVDHARNLVRRGYAEYTTGKQKSRPTEEKAKSGK